MVVRIDSGIPAIYDESHAELWVHVDLSTAKPYSSLNVPCDLGPLVL